MNQRMEELKIEVIDLHSISPPSEVASVPHGTIPPAKQPPEQPNKQPSLTPEVEVKRYIELHRAATEGDWDAAKRIIDKDRNALKATISLQGMTVLHVAARNGRSEFVEKLVDLLRPDELAKRDKYGRNSLHYIAAVGTVRAAERMVEKNQNLPQDTDNRGYTPIFTAVKLGLPQMRGEMLKFLVNKTEDKPPSSPFSGKTSTELILLIVASGYYDVALDLIEKKNGNLALAMDENGETILQFIAKDPSAFRSGTKLGFWKRLLFPRTSIDIKSSIQLEQGNLVSLVERVCLAVLELKNEEMQEYADSFIATMHLATKNGVVELVQIILKYFPDLIWVAQNDRLLLHVAIEHRRDKVFNYLVKLTGERRFAFSNAVVEESGDNILHLAAKLAPLSQLHSVTGTSLQMQRELQWFKEVEKLVHGAARWATNNEQKTPQQLFTEKHMKLHEEGEKWMKDTSTNCMVVATLIATIVFAAIITVPGGIHGDRGTPIFLRKIPFVVFIISNGLAVFASMTSLLVFLSILTTRYAEEDFLRSLPMKLVAGLSFLLIAIVTMTIAFAAALHIAVHSMFQLSYIVSVFLGCVPVILFLRLHLPLFLQVIKSTCGPGIFEQSEPKHGWSLLWLREKKE